MGLWKSKCVRFGFASIESLAVNHGDISVFPNPTNGEFFLNFDSQTKGKMTLNIFAVQGQKVYSDVINVTSGTNQKELNISNLQDGIYFLMLNSGKKVTCKKLIIRN